MENTDHIYTSTTYDKFNPVEFTYKLTGKEIEDFVKLRVSNNFLFSGKRNASMWAWRAILKHMGLQNKMTHNQVSKKWENLKKKYKELKNPPEGVTVFPEMWPHYKLLEDAMEGRLAGSAPILSALPADRDDSEFLPTFRPKKRKICVMKSAPASSNSNEPEVEVTLNGDEDRAEEDADMEVECEEVEQAMREVENERARLESEKVMMESERGALQRERRVLAREKVTLERENAALDRDRASLERERAVIERDKMVMDREKAVLERDKEILNKERLVLEREKASFEKATADRLRTEESAAEAEDGEKTKDYVSADRKEQFLNLFEKLIEKF